MSLKFEVEGNGLLAQNTQNRICATLDLSVGVGPGGEEGHSTNAKDSWYSY